MKILFQNACHMKVYSEKHFICSRKFELENSF